MYGIKYDKDKNHWQYGLKLNDTFTSLFSSEDFSKVICFMKDFIPEDMATKPFQSLNALNYWVTNKPEENFNKNVANKHSTAAMYKAIRETVLEGHENATTIEVFIPPLMLALLLDTQINWGYKDGAYRSLFEKVFQLLLSMHEDLVSYPHAQLVPSAVSGLDTLSTVSFKDVRATLVEVSSVSSVNKESAIENASVKSTETSS